MEGGGLADRDGGLSRRPEASWLWLSGQEGIAVNLEPARILLTAGTFEGVDLRADHHINEPDFFQHLLPGCTRQTTGNSSCPKVDVLNGRFRDRLAVGDVGKLKVSAGA
jgi:hypothetical protein